MSDKLKGNWNVLKGKLQQQYADLTDDDVLYEEGKENELYGRLQARLGKTKEEVNELFDRLSTTSADRVV
ncbi:MAG: CsbD family protein [Flavobacteriales bacterium]|nr:CsbD family protein [Flavobacteriales bacterium]